MASVRPSAVDPQAPSPSRLRRLGIGRRKRVTAFVLSGGASLGALQAGSLHALYEAGIGPDLIVGTSVGALNGAFIATRPPTTDTTVALAQVWTGLHRSQLFALRPDRLIAGLGGHRNHLFSDDGLRKLVEEHIQIRRLEDSPIPLHVTAYDTLNGDDVRLSEGPAADAVLAASAIPGVFPPVELDGHLLGDGGVVNNTPLSHAIELGATHVYVLPTVSPERVEVPRPKGALDAAVNAIILLINRRLHEDIARYSDSVRITVLPATNKQHIQPTDFSHAEEMIRSALEDGREALGATPRRARIPAAAS